MKVGAKVLSDLVIFSILSSEIPLDFLPSDLHLYLHDICFVKIFDSCNMYI